MIQVEECLCLMVTIEPNLFIKTWHPNEKKITLNPLKVGTYTIATCDGKASVPTFNKIVTWKQTPQSSVLHSHLITQM